MTISPIRMQRFSQQAREIFTTVFYDTDMDKAIELIESINPEDVLSIAFGKCSITYYYMYCGFTMKLYLTLRELDSINRTLNDPFVHIWTHLMNFSYYSGFDKHIADRDLAIQHFERAGEWYAWYNGLFVQNQLGVDQSVTVASNIVPDDWERYFVTGFYLLQKGVYLRNIDNNLKSGIISMQKGVDLLRKVPDDGEYMSKNLPFAENEVGWFHYLDGNFEEAEKRLRVALKATSNYPNLWGSIPTGILATINFVKGDAKSAKKFLDESLKITKKYNFAWGMYKNLGLMGDILSAEGRHNEALESWNGRIEWAENIGEPSLVFFSHYTIFNYYYIRFTTTRDRDFLLKAEEILETLEKLTKDPTDDPTPINLTRFCQARILKQGNLKKKGKAIEILENLGKVVVKDWQILMELVDSLFEDVLLTGDEESIEHIDQLMEKLNEINLFSNPTMIISSISGQILLAKYNFYIKGDPKTALEMLEKAKESVNTYNLVHITELIDTEVKILVDEMSKWDKVVHSVRERIKTSEFTKYIQEAMESRDILDSKIT